jgi:hypothetical protein
VRGTSALLLISIEAAREPPAAPCSLAAPISAIFQSNFSAEPFYDGYRTKFDSEGLS